MYVVVPVFNRPDLLDRCVESVLAQEDDDFILIVADDASSDPAMPAALDSVSEAMGTVIVRPENLGATRNITEAIRATEMEPTDVVLLVDGDDRLAHPLVLERLRQAYRGDVEMTYGSYYPDPFDPGCYPARPIPDDVLATGTIRQFTRTVGQWFNHPLSFRRRAFDAIHEHDFHWNLDPDAPWMRHGYDLVLGIPLLELVGRRAEWIPNLLYVYTSDRPEACWREKPDEITAEYTEVLNRDRRLWPYDA